MELLTPCAVPPLAVMEETVKKYRSMGAACLAVALAAASPALARGGGGGGGHGGGGGFHGGGGGFHGGMGGGGFRAGGFRGGGAHFAGGGFRGGGFRRGLGGYGGGYGYGGYGGGYGGYGGYGYDDYGPGIVGGLIAGSLFGAGMGYSYDPGYYDNSYAYTAGPATVDSGYCIRRYKSYDPGSGTYLGYDGMRHPCP